MCAPEICRFCSVSRSSASDCPCRTRLCRRPIPRQRDNNPTSFSAITSSSLVADAAPNSFCRRVLSRPTGSLSTAAFLRIRPLIPRSLCFLQKHSFASSLSAVQKCSRLASGCAASWVILLSVSSNLIFQTMTTILSFSTIHLQAAAKVSLSSCGCLRSADSGGFFTSSTPKRNSLARVDGHGNFLFEFLTSYVPILQVFSTLQFDLQIPLTYKRNRFCFEVLYRRACVLRCASCSQQTC